MGNTQTYPNAQAEVSTTIFFVDYVFWSITAIAKTILFTTWMLYAYCNLNIVPTQTEMPKQPEVQVTRKTRTIEIIDSDGNRSRSTTREDTDKRGTIGTVSAGTDITATVESLHEDAIITASSAKHPMSLKARLYVTMSILNALVYSYFYVILHTLRYMRIVNEFSCALPAISLGLGWALNRLFLYLYLMHRLKTSFKNTFLEIKPRHYNILMRMYIVLISIGALFYFMFGSFVGCDGLGTSYDGLGILISFLPLNAFDSFCALVCLYIFIKKLKRLVNMDQIAYNKDPKGMTDLKYLVNKFLIISLFAILFTYFVAILFFIYPLKSLAGVDTCVNVYCLMITTANYDFYYRVSCVLCRGRCERSFTFANQIQKDQPAVIIH